MAVTTDPLFQPLLSGRRRLRLGKVLGAGSAALCAGGAVWLTGEVAIRLGWPRSVWLFVLPMGAAVAAAGLAARLCRLPMRNDLALLIDQRAGLGLGYATAVEAAENVPPGPVAERLLAEARNQAAKLDTRQLLPLCSRLMVLSAVGGLMAGGMAALLSLRSPSMPPAGASAPLATAEDLRSRALELAERLNRHAELNHDPVLAAIARALEERVVTSPPGTESAAMAGELDALADQARRAFGNAPPDWLTALSGTAADGARPTESAAEGGTPVPPLGEDTFAVDMNEINRARRAQAALHGDQTSEAGTGAAGTARDGGPLGEAVPPPHQTEPQRMLLAGRELVGGAAESGRGPGDQAGAGTRSLEGQALADPSRAEDTPMPLPQAAQETGRRIRIMLPPPSEAAAGGRPTGPVGHPITPAGAQTVERVAPPAISRATVARYFERPSE